MSDYLAIDDSTNIAVSGLWNKDSLIPDGHTLIMCGDSENLEHRGRIGDLWNGTVWVDNNYKENRKAGYPPMENYLDGIVKGDQAQIDKYISDCLAVKERFPKE